MVASTPPSLRTASRRAASGVIPAADGVVDVHLQVRLELLGEFPLLAGPAEDPR